MMATRVEKHIIKSNNEYYSVLDSFCFKAKNLYNHTNYLIRQELFNNNNLSYEELDRILKNDIQYPDYRDMPTAQCAQQVIKLVTKNWKSYYKAIKDWSKHKDKYLGMPKLPKYKPKKGRSILIVTNQNAKIKNGILQFPKKFSGFTLKPKFTTLSNYLSLQQVRFIPKNKYIVAEIVYTIEIPAKCNDNNRYLSIDIGVDNLVAITNNFNEVPILINGKGLKSINQYYNKKLAHYKSIAKCMNGLDYTNRQNKLTTKRNFKVLDFMHKTSRYIVEYAKNHSVSTIVIGYNKGWKQNSDMGAVNNQNFVQIPFYTLVQQIQYKCEQYGINVISQEESYTSGTSFLDNELPTIQYYNKTRRIYRGLFRSDKEIFINADVNASFQIMKKVYPNAYANGLEAVVFQPIKVNIC